MPNLFVCCGVFLLLVHHSKAGTLDTCTDHQSEAVKSSALLQVSSDIPGHRKVTSHDAAVETSKSATSKTPGSKKSSKTSATTVSKAVASTSVSKATSETSSKAAFIHSQAASKVDVIEMRKRIKAQMPPHLLRLGIQLLGSKKSLNELIDSSRWVNVSYGGTPILIRVMNGQYGNVTEAVWPDQFGVSTLKDVVLLQGPLKQQRHINMIDMGGKHGVASIAAYKKYPGRLRAVIVEPIASTYFIIRWNMWLNDVPTLDDESFQLGVNTGIMALHRAVAKTDSGIDMCYLPPHAQTAKVCDCQTSDLAPGEQCMHVAGIRTNSLVNLFGTDPIAIMKIDCEGCEYVSMPELLQMRNLSRIGRLAGELHWPTRDLEAIACKFESGKFFIRQCDQGQLALDCDKNPKPCLRSTQIQKIKKLSRLRDSMASSDDDDASLGHASLLEYYSN